MQDHEKWMQMALAIARKGEGLTHPNPPVGAVIVRGNKLVAEAYHHHAGAYHAERLALASATQRAHGATLYTTLEPCSTSGRTPPCTDAIIQSGIKCVIVGARDPNPIHAGRGLNILKANGINIIEGVCAGSAKELIAPFAKWVQTGKPYLTLKLGMSLDGKIADRQKSSRWITGSESRGIVQDLRRKVDAIMVGAATVCRDDPSLLPRPARRRKPFRLILASHGIIPASAKVLTDGAQKQTIVVTTPSISRSRYNALLRRGVAVWTVRSVAGRISLLSLFSRLGKYGILHVLCEGGAELAASCIQKKLVDEFVFFIAPRILGGLNAVSAVGGNGWRLNAAPMLKFIECQHNKRDIMIRAKPV